MSTTLMPSATVTSRDPKGAAFIAKVEAAYNKAGLSEREAQRIHEAPLADLLAKFFAENRTVEEFANEEVASSYVYPTGYEINDLADQVKMLVKLFPGLDATETLAFIQNELPKLALPQGAEGWFAVPNWKKLGSTYNEALDEVLAKIEKKRSNFRNYRKGETGPEYLRQTPRSAEAWEKLMEQQKGDILIVALQLGFRHRGRSVRRARAVIVDNVGEFALGAFAVGCVALTHPKRFQRQDELDVDCSGDDYAPDGGGRFSESVVFYVSDDEFEFAWRSLGDAGAYFGSASGFLPQ